MNNCCRKISVLDRFVPLLMCMVVGSAFSEPVKGQTDSRDDQRLVSYVTSLDLASLTSGRQVYDGACAACHGASGDGRGPGAGPLNPRPRDFTSGVFKFRSTPSGDLPTDEDLYKTITNGVPRTAMPSWTNLLTEQDRLDVVAYIKTFSKDFADYGAGTAIVVPTEPEVTVASISEGQHLYMIMECWSCHGKHGRGDGEAAGTLTDDQGRKISAFDFTTGHYKAGSESSEIYKTFNTGLDGTPMPSFADAFIFGSDSISDFESYRSTYSEEEIASLVTYLNKQPTRQQFRSLSETESEQITGRRKWALVHFVKSLARKPGLFYRLFKHDYEVTQ